ncbi:sugar porter family MFS transporter [uncultured Leifsonia sp.]|uniref:sugar porter family MFS transporter n=1 Tax=uncultured Leifsonia sp. TaxID=340359 RepID=UPI0025EE7874|nr:sugar porter family MFS transporter [uncultured Leifsonia sp.]
MTATPDPQTTDTQATTRQTTDPQTDPPPADLAQDSRADDPRARRFLRRIAVLATFGGLLFGYDTGVISGALPFMQFDQRPLTPLEEGTVVSSLLVGAALGSFAGGRIADRRGRRRLIAGLAVIFFAAALACAFAPGIGIMIAARFTLGLAVGGASVVVPMYLAELSPAARRGRIVTQNELMIVSGQLAAFVVNAVLAAAIPDHAAVWRWMLVVASLPAVVLFFGMLVVPESPRWLILHGRFAEGVAVLRRIRSAEQAEREAAEIHRHDERAARTPLLRELAVPWVRRVFLIGLGIAMVQQLTGVNSIMYYGVQILQRSGFDQQGALVGQIANGVISVLATFVGIALLGRVGRRPLLIAGLIGTTTSLLLVGGASALLAGSPALPFVVLSLTVTFLAFQQGAVSPVTWLMLAEILPARIRGAAFGLAALVLWLTNFAVGFLFPQLVDGLGISPTFFLFAAVGVCAVIFVARFLPETRGRSLEALEAELKARFTR